MKPTIGRIVHYIVGGQHLAAIIVHVWSDICVNLISFDLNGRILPRASVLHSEYNGENTWHWSERTES